MSGMNKYLVYYRDPKAMGMYLSNINAHRVEGWSSDYAFFGHREFPGTVTRLIPRELVREVEMSYDASGLEPDPCPMGSAEAQSIAFEQQVDRWRTANPGLISVVSHDRVYLEQEQPDGSVTSSSVVSRDGWGVDEAAALVDALANDLSLDRPTDALNDTQNVMTYQEIVDG